MCEEDPEEELKQGSAAPSQAGPQACMYTWREHCQPLGRDRHLITRRRWRGAGAERVLAPPSPNESTGPVR